MANPTPAQPKGQKDVFTLELKLTPDQIATLQGVACADGALKAIFTGSTLDKDKLVISYVACNAGTGATM